VIDAKQEILNTIKPLIEKNKILQQLEHEDILEIIEHLLEYQFKPNEKKTKSFIDEKISEMATNMLKNEVIE